MPVRLDAPSPVTYPSGTVAFLFTDIEGSTKLWEHDPAAMQIVVERHFSLLRMSIERHQGVLFKTIGDAVQAAFPTARDGLAAAAAGQRALATEPWPDATGSLRVRMALHAGAATPVDRDYLAPCLNRLARFLTVGYGGQILLTDVVRRLLDGWLPEGVALRDLGRHRLRDLLEPEEVWQAAIDGLPEEFPALKSLEGYPTNLPIQLTPLIGREAELNQISAWITQLTGHLVTLTGPGGIGKTRLALQVGAEALDAFRDGVFFVELAPLTDPALVLPTIAVTLGVKERADEPIGEALVAWLKSQTLLLVLDNFEQVMRAAVTVADLRKKCPGVTILATSQERLNVSGEQVLPVPPLTLPPPLPKPTVGDEAETAGVLEAIGRAEAVRLFIERAQSVQPEFRLTAENADAVVEICRRLDGLPLAIQLAAVRVRMLPPKALLARLKQRLPLLTGGSRDAPARLQTMRATIDWSYDLLSEEDKILFRRLAVFAGGWTLEAAEGAANPDGTLDVFNGLASVVDKSLVQERDVKGEPRYTMLETTREYAREQLNGSGETPSEEQTAVEEAHAAYYLQLADRARAKGEPELYGPDLEVWIAQMQAEYDNVWTALQWLIVRGDTRRALQLGAAISNFWYSRTIFLSEGLDVLGELHRLPGADAHREELAKVVTAMGMLHYALRDPKQACDCYYHALKLWPPEQALGIAWTRGNLGDALFDRSILDDGSFDLTLIDAAKSELDSCLRLYRPRQHRAGQAWALRGLAKVEQSQGNFTVATTHLRTALSLLEGTKDRLGQAFTQEDLAYALLAWQPRQHLRETSVLFRNSIQVFWEKGHQWGLAASLSGLAGVAAACDRAEQAAELLGAAELLWDEPIKGVPLQFLPRHSGTAGAAQNALGTAAFANAFNRGKSLAGRVIDDRKLAPAPGWAKAGSSDSADVAWWSWLTEAFTEITTAANQYGSPSSG